jgi:branched-subunit amino acid aminotransferase/4-amino-4-deoxychorismate lyase
MTNLHPFSSRSLYEREYAQLCQPGCYEVLLVNEDGALTEGSRSNLVVGNHLVYNGIGGYAFKPIACSLLDGVYRRLLLEGAPWLREKVLNLEDLFGADAIYGGTPYADWFVPH